MSDGGINKFIKIIAVAVLLPLSVAVPLLSVESYYAPQIQAQTDADLEARKEAYKVALKTKITASVATRIKLRCLAVQANLQTFSAKVGTVKTNRETAYNNVLKELDKLVKGLQNQGYDTTKLEEHIATLAGHVDEFESAIREYKQTVEDLTVIDCTKDPTSYKAALEAARRQHLEIIGIVQAIRADVINSIKPVLSQVRQDVLSDATKSQQSQESSSESQ